jgi:chromosomal replication initiation ATPase DnaA
MIVMNNSVPEIKKTISFLSAPEMHSSGWIAVTAVVKDLVTINEILSSVCEVLEISAKDICAPDRGIKYNLSEARALYSYFSKFLTTKTDTQIAKLINKDSVSVGVGIKRVMDLLSVEDESMMQKYLLVTARLKTIQCKAAA